MDGFFFNMVFGIKIGWDIYTSFNFLM